MTRLRGFLVPALIVWSAGCNLMGQKINAGPGLPTAPGVATGEGVGFKRSGSFPMPDVTGMTRVAAEGALRGQGITGTISADDSYLCDDPKVKADEVCLTQPAAGQSTTATIPVALHLRKKGTASYAMPDLKGKTADEARKLLADLGQIEQRVRIEELPVVLDGCQPERVCRQDPAPGAPTKESEYKELKLAPRQ